MLSNAPSAAVGLSQPQAARAARPYLGLGVAAIALAVAFNVPFSLLAAMFDYPNVLRRPAGEALAMFAAAGPDLILVWYGFMLSALALAVMAPGLAVSGGRIAARPGLAIGAAVTGALAGLAQAVGLSRWIFAVPALAAHPADPASAQAFALLNAWGGVAIGEHIGQLLTAAFVAQAALMQFGERARITAALGLFTAFTLMVGTGEGLAIALGRSGALFAVVTIVGFMGLTLWLIATGVCLIRRRA
ncbi:MAG: DUF4386 family protein [Caulobacterales bacterium]|nr:DUF4386 family protein [Caulobacterales bacterium]